MFGGYLGGVKSNIFFKIDLASKQITIINETQPLNGSSSTMKLAHQPCHRTASRLAYSQKQNSLYLFGGLTVTNQTLNDMWRFSIDSGEWEQVEQLGDVPDPRCGHTFATHNEKIFLFGGLKEVTKESNETFRFDIETRMWH